LTQETQSGDNLPAILKSLSDEELATLRYFLRYRSVGEILVSRELRAMGIKNPSKILAKLVSLGLIKRGIGCYTVSKNVIDAFRRGEIEI